MFEGEWPVPMQMLQSTTPNPIVNESIEHKCDNTPQSIPTGTPAPIQNCRNSLTGLAQYNKALYGHGKHRTAT